MSDDKKTYHDEDEDRCLRFGARLHMMKPPAVLGSAIEAIDVSDWEFSAGLKLEEYVVAAIKKHTANMVTEALRDVMRYENSEVQFYRLAGIGLGDEERAADPLDLVVTFGFIYEDYSASFLFNLREVLAWELANNHDLIEGWPEEIQQFSDIAAGLETMAAEIRTRLAGITPRPDPPKKKPKKKGGAA